MYLLYSSRINSSVKFKNYVEKNSLPVKMLDVVNDVVKVFAKKNMIATIPTIITDNGDLIIGKQCVTYVGQYIQLMKTKKQNFSNGFDNRFCPVNNGGSWMPDASRQYSDDELKQLMQPRKQMFSGKSFIGENITSAINPIENNRRKMSADEIKRLKRPNKRIIPAVGLLGQPIQELPRNLQNDGEKDQPFPSIKLSSTNKSMDNERLMAQMLKERQDQDKQFDYR